MLPRISGVLVALIVMTCSAPILAQTRVGSSTVVPVTAGQSQVRWQAFDWRYSDLPAEASARTGKGLRFYYYQREQALAERLATDVESQYRQLVERFDYAPTQRFPYVLYASQTGFLQTNLFFVTENVLGVTSPEDLRMAVPYGGDDRVFRHTSLHELVHQLTIQKVNDVGRAHDLSGSSLSKMPLWFIEGIAEWYSTPGGLDAEADMFVRDVVVNPEAGAGGLPGLFDDPGLSYLYTYKLGQARAEFLASTFGPSVLQDVLEQSYRLRAKRQEPEPLRPEPGLDTPSKQREKDQGPLTFEELLGALTGTKPEQLSAKWDAWLRRRYYRGYLDSSQSFADLQRVEDQPEYFDSFAASPDGNVLVLRTVDPVTQRARLQIMDRRDGSSRKTIRADSEPGADSLHFGRHPVASVGRKSVVYAVQRGPADVLVWRSWRARIKEGGREPEVKLRVGPAKTLLVGRKHALLEIRTPVLSPDGRRVAFIGLDESASTDLFVFDLDTRKLRRITRDGQTKRDLSWGASGIVMTSDDTESGYFNLFGVDPATGASRRLTREAADHSAPSFAPDGSILFVSDGSGKPSLYRLPASAVSGVVTASLAEVAVTPQQVVQLTDLPTGVQQAAQARDRILVRALEGGAFHLFEMPQSAALDRPVQLAAAQQPGPLARKIVPLKDSHSYSALSLRSWSLQNVFAVFSSAGYGQGFAVAQDRFRDHTAYADVQVFGAPELTNAHLAYINRKARTSWELAAFHEADLFFDSVASDPVAPSAEGNTWNEVLYVERVLGAEAGLTYPFSRYLHATARVGLGSVTRSPCLTRYEWVPVGGGYLQPAASGSCTRFDFGPFADDAYQTFRNRLGGSEPLGRLGLSFGFDTAARTPGTGPVAGTSVLLWGDVSALPQREAAYGRAQLDAEQWIRVFRTTNLGFRLAGGHAAGQPFARRFFVWPNFNLRGIPFTGKYADLYTGRSYGLAQAELQVPLNSIVRVAFLEQIEGILALDSGTVFDDPADAASRRTAAFVAGFNFNIAFLQMRLHFARPLDIGGLKPGTDMPNRWVTQFWLGYAYF